MRDTERARNTERVTGRGRDWLEALYRAYQPAFYAYAARRMPADEVDDLVAEVFTTAWRKRDAVPDHALPWLYRVARHHVLHARRGGARHARLVERLSRDAAAIENPVDVDARVDAHSAVRAMMAELPEADAEILRLAASEELSAADIGVVLGCSAGAARVRLHRAKRRAQNILEALEADAGQPRGATLHAPDAIPTQPASTPPHPTVAIQEARS